jgi:hypothetical protein
MSPLIKLGKEDAYLPGNHAVVTKVAYAGEHQQDIYFEDVT